MKKAYRKYIKRIIDMLSSITLLILFLPVFIIISFIIKIDSKGSIFYTQTRLGMNKKEFQIYKFRTMKVGADESGTKTLINDCRITRAGKIIRKLSLDELPQLLNVLIGNMSLVGFRPGVLENYTDETMRSKLFDIRPGITGLAQVKGRSNLAYEDRRRLEIEYIETMSFITDIKILVMTVMKIFKNSDVK